MKQIKCEETNGRVKITIGLGTVEQKLAEIKENRAAGKLTMEDLDDKLDIVLEKLDELRR